MYLSAYVRSHEICDPTMCVCVCVTKFICKHEFIKCEALEGFIIDKYINVALI